MKRPCLIPTLSLFLILLAGFCTVKDAAGQGPVPKRYAIESGVIEYSFEGIQSGTETVYFDRWGMREARYAKGQVRQGGRTQKIDRLLLRDGDWVYNIDLDKKIGAQSPNPFRLPPQVPGEQTSVEMNEEIMQKIGGVKTGSEKVAGKKCDIWEVQAMGSKSWLWKWIPLKTQSLIPNMKVTMTATRVEERPVSADKFQIPKDVQIMRMPLTGPPPTARDEKNKT